MEAHSVKRKLAAILAADVKGYSRLMGEDEEATLHTLHAYRQVTDARIEQHQGRIVSTAGDSILAEFASVVDAVRCAVDIQRELKTHNAALPASRQMEFRIGINLGDVMVDGEQIYGDGVNIAARLEAVAEPGGICISGTVHEQIENKLALKYEALGEQTVKNIARPVRVWRVRVEESGSLEFGVRSSESQGHSPALRRVGIAHRSWVIAATAGLLLIVGTIAAIRYFARPPLSPQSSALSTQEAPALPLPDKPSIAVLPFVNLSNNPDQEYFSDGISEVLITDLSKIAGLFVIARNSTFAYKGKAVKVQDVARELGVQYILEGGVLRSENQVRITTQLIDAGTGRHLWAERYDRPLKDIFALQDEIVQRIVTTLKLQFSLLGQGVDISRRTTDSPEAWDYLLRGMEALSRFTKEANVEARRMFEKAVEVDSGFAGAYGGLGWTYYMEWSRRWNQSPQALERAFALAQKAIALNDSLPGAHLLLGWIYIGRKQHEQAIAEAERVVALEPNSADGWSMLGQFLSFAGRSEEAIGLVQKAMRLNPRHLALYEFYLGYAYWLTRRYEEAIEAHKRALIRNPDYQPSRVNLAVIYSELGRETEAQETVASLIKMDPNFSLNVVGQTWSYNRDPAVVERVLAALRQAGLK